MICRVIGIKDTGILVHTNRVNKDMASHLKANGSYIGSGNWKYTGGQQRLLFAVGQYIGLGKKAYIKKQLGGITPFVK